VQLLILQAFCLVFRQNEPNLAEYCDEAQLKRDMAHILTVAKKPVRSLRHEKPI